MRKQKRIIAIALAFISLISVVTLGIGPAQAAEPDRHVTVTGVGTISVVPDAVRFFPSVTAIANKSSDALATASKTATAVRAALRSAGIATKDIKSSNLSVYPEYNYTQDKGSVQIGYRASQSFTVVVKNAANAGVVVDAIAAAGGDFLQLQGVSPFVLDSSKATEAARAAAVKNAKAKAASYAKLMGVKLGKVNYLTEGGATYQPPIYGVAKASADSATVIDLGTQDVSVSISVQWALI